MEEPMHNMLRRQMKRHLGSADAVPPEWTPLLQAVNDAYHEFDKDRGMLERSLELSSAELIQVNADLRESDERYRAFLDATADMVFLKDAQLHYVVLNEANRAFFGLPMEEIVGKTDHDLMPKSMADACRETDQRALAENGVVISQEQVNNRIYETRKFPLRLRSGAMGVGGFVRDITERKQAEEELMEQMNELRRWQAVMLDREDRVIALKKEVNELARKLGEKPRYEGGLKAE